MKDIKLYLDGLNCANCAGKIEDKVNKLTDVDEAVLNFSTKLLLITPKEGVSEKELEEKVEKIVLDLEPDVKVLKDKNKIKSSVNTCNDGCCGEGESHKHNNVESHSHSHEHGHSHSHGGNSGIEKKELFRLGIALTLFIIGMIVNLDKMYEFIIFGVAYIIAGGKVLLRAFKNILRGQVFDENFLMAIATIGAFAIGEFPEGVAVMLFYEVGEMFQDYAVNKSRKSISDLMNIRPDFANLIDLNGEEKRVSPESVNVGSIIVVRAGEKVPLDGVVLSGEATLDVSALTGESLPKEVEAKDDVLAGSINKSGLLKIKVTKSFGESTVSKILDLVENAGNKKSPTEKFITKFARYYTPVVVFSALALAIIPPLVISGESFSPWISRALIFLVVSCPCALVVSIPLGYFAGIGLASKNGILIKGSNYLEALNNVESIVFDKTGTLTKGTFKVRKSESTSKLTNEELLKLGAYAEYYSNHPIAKSIVSEFNEEINKGLISNYEEISGKGIKVDIDGETFLAGNSKLMDMFNIKITSIHEIGTVVYLANEKSELGYIVISDEIKEDSKEAISGLKEIGVKQTIMLTGDNEKVGDSVAKELGLDKAYCSLLPQNKVEKLEQIFEDKSKGKKVAFVGDGINDAPVLARADIGIAMGGVGSDAAIEAADVVIMDDKPSKIIKAIKIAKKTNKIVWQNIIFALGVKIIILIFGALGMANMWEAVFGDVGVTLIAVINSSRILKNKNL
ncbi:heavy metal translocating P-type ATPase [Clostridium perfringens]|uniref:heavy metal translocating P-type ATPase n=1 Tax=Clostridium perfringens TaxID=1502 RepID=UPI001ABAC092|nr:heavy metal translocating P-type ATPase [Clostridium perfringens]EJT6496577.1 cadmium-translocating P-type ATPase [Clostridium perfringens]ELC8342448.1 cadmium-translocating P-type ATPase [Clostridium perfringens]MBO3313716.1 cadmium-translocating P-type ATPase [Clostridium perfringens]MBO3362912.1 cadmium-translocating P-type ATPase [Clostridium perfringens]MDH5067178.1 Cadmium zinc and cobalt-transporting ATPase [Clostridium perfringens]